LGDPLTVGLLTGPTRTAPGACPKPLMEREDQSPPLHQRHLPQGLAPTGSGLAAGAEAVKAALDGGHAAWSWQPTPGPAAAGAHEPASRSPSPPAPAVIRLNSSELSARSLSAVVVCWWVLGGAGSGSCWVRVGGRGRG
jgi:hypothetical protein